MNKEDAATESEIEDFVILQHAGALLAKTNASDLYKKSGWLKLTVGIYKTLNWIPGLGQFDKASVRPELKGEIEVYHMHSWGYPVDVMLFFEVEGMVLGIYHDYVIGNNWTFILSNDFNSIVAELPIPIIKGFITDKIDRAKSEAQIYLLIAIKLRLETDGTT